MKEARSSYPMSVDERDQIERELDELGYRETHDPDIADRRRSTRSRGGTRRAARRNAHPLAMI